MLKEVLIELKIIKQNIKDNLIYVWAYIWNQKLKLSWYKLWIRKNEFHKSLDTDMDAMFNMNEKQKENYINDLVKRRNIAHNRDFNKINK